MFLPPSLAEILPAQVPVKEDRTQNDIVKDLADADPACNGNKSCASITYLNRTYSSASTALSAVVVVYSILLLKPLSVGALVELLTQV